MTMIHAKTEKLIEDVKEFKAKFLKANAESIMEMEPTEFETIKSVLKFIDYALEVAKEQARVIEEVDRKLDDVNSKLDVLLKLKV